MQDTVCCMNCRNAWTLPAHSRAAQDMVTLGNYSDSMAHAADSSRLQHAQADTGVSLHEHIHSRCSIWSQIQHVVNIKSHICFLTLRALTLCWVCARQECHICNAAP